MQPDISILTVCRNAETSIANCLRSVNEQTIASEHIIIDGRSTDNTIRIIHECANPSVQVISEQDSGMYDAMNKGIQLAQGEIIGILNSDDVYNSPEVLALVKNLFRNPAVLACYGDLIYVTPDNVTHINRYWKAGHYTTKKFYAGWMPPHPTFFVRHCIYKKYGTFNTAIGSAADYELMLRFMLKNKIRTEYIPKVLVKMSTGGVSNACFKNRLKANLMDRKAWKVNNLTPYPWTLWIKPLRKIMQWFARPQLEK